MPVELPIKVVDWYGPYPPCQSAEWNGNDTCTRPARYDVPTRLGPWANLCTECATEWGSAAQRSLGKHFVQVLEEVADFPHTAEQRLEDLEARVRSCEAYVTELREALGGIL